MRRKALFVGLVLVLAFSVLGCAVKQRQSYQGRDINVGVPVTVLGVVKEVRGNTITLTAYFSPKEFATDRTKGKKALIEVTRETKYRIIEARRETPKPGEKFEPPARDGTLPDVKKGSLVTILARLEANSRLIAKEVMAFPPIEGAKLPEDIKTLSGTVKSVQGESIYIEVEDKEVKIVVDSRTGFSKGHSGSGEKPQSGSLSEIKVGSTINVAGKENSDKSITALAINYE